MCKSKVAAGAGILIAGGFKFVDLDYSSLYAHLDISNMYFDIEHIIRKKKIEKLKIVLNK